jgi:hypothetical protein
LTLTRRVTLGELWTFAEAYARKNTYRAGNYHTVPNCANFATKMWTEIVRVNDGAATRARPASARTPKTLDSLLDGQWAKAVLPAQHPLRSKMENSLALALAQPSLRAAASPKKAKPRRLRPVSHTSWSETKSPENAAHMMKCIQRWQALQATPVADRPIALRGRCLGLFLEIFNAEDPTLPDIPRKTFEGHLARFLAPGGRSFLRDVRVGRPAKIPLEDQQEIARVLSLYDHANQGKDAAYAARAILVDTFGLSKRQARNFWHHTLKHVKLDGVPMLSSAKADPVSNKRTAAITEAKQRHFFKVVEAARKFCADNSPPEADGTTLRDLEEHFVGNADEEVAMASTDGNVRIVGAAGKKRHLRNSHTSRASLSFLRSGLLPIPRDRSLLQCCPRHCCRGKGANHLFG